MTIRFKQKVLGVAVEGSYGVSGSPDPASAAIRTINFEVEPLNFDSLELPYDKDTYGANAKTLFRQHVRVSFEVPLNGSGSAVDDVPAWGVLMRGCGHSETVNASTNVTYAPIDSGAPSLTLQYHVGARQQIALGARGALTGVRIAKGGFPVFRMEYIGLYADPTHQATLPVPDVSAWQNPLRFSAANSSATWNALTLPLHELELVGGQNVEFRETSESEVIQQSDRVSTFSMLFDEPLISATNYYNLIAAETQGALSVIHGTSANSIVELAAPNAQITSPPRAEDQQGLSALRVTGELIPGSGAAEYSIISR